MTVNYHEFNPIQYFSEITHVAGFHEGKDSPDLHIELVDQKAKEVLSILEDCGIEAKRSPGNEGCTQIRIPRKAIDQMIACRKALGVLAPLDVSPLVKAINKASLSPSDKNQVEAVLKEIRDNKNMSVPELMKRSDLDELQSMLQKVYSKYRKTICSDVLKNIATAKTQRQENEKRIFTELEQAKPDPSKIEALLHAGADITQADKAGWALYRAASQGQLDAIVALIAGEAGVNLADKKGGTALHIAASEGDVKAIAALIARGAKVNQADKQGRTALHLAATKGNANALAALIDAGAKVNQEDDQELTALDRAASKGHAEAVATLLAKGADVNHVVEEGLTALDLAVNKEYTDVIAKLIAGGSNLNHEDQRGWTALHRAVAKGKVDTIQALISGGADINKPSKDGQTPLHQAALRDEPVSFQALMSAGADVKKANKEGKTPLSLSLVSDHSDADGFMRFLTKSGYGPDLMRLVIQEGGSRTNTQALLRALAETQELDKLIPELLPLVEFNAIPNLIEIAKTDAIASHFLEELVIAKLSAQWAPSHLENGEWQRLLDQQPFLFRQSSHPSEFIVQTAERAVVIPKSQFYELWVQEQGDPERMEQAVFNVHQQPEDGVYVMQFVRSELQTHPEQILKTLSEQFQHSIHSQLNIQFEGEVGADAGGLGRQLVGQLLSEIGRKMQFEKRDNGLFRPRLRENSEGEILPLTESDKATYRQLGQLMMFCLNASVPYPVGMLFDQGVFTAIARMKSKDLRKEFEEIDFTDPAIFGRMLGIYKEINRYSESDVKMIERLESYLAPKSDSELTEAYAIVMQDPSIEKLQINDDVKKMKQHQAEIMVAVRKYIVANNLRRTFAPLHEIAKGMRESPFNSRLSFTDVLRMDPVELSRTVQGTVSKEDILKKLQFEEEIPENIQSWFKTWIEKANDKKIEHFIFALSGSSALGQDAQIKIAKGGNIAFHTCFNTLDVNWYKNKETKELYSEQELTNNLEWALNYVMEHSGFDMV